MRGGNVCHGDLHWTLLANATTTSGQSACAPAATRSARPVRLPCSSWANHATRLNSVPPATTEDPGRNAGFEVARRPARRGHAPRARNEVPAAKACARELPALGSGKAATNKVATPPTARSTLPDLPAGRSPSAVTTWHVPRPTRLDVIIHRSAAPRRASALIVSRVAS